MSSKLNSKQNERLIASNVVVISDVVGRIIAENAYYKAERRGFEPGYEERDWIESERDVLINTAQLCDY
jgi:hypothetical protein